MSTPAKTHHGPLAGVILGSLASPGTTDSHLNLASGVVKQAALDLRSNDLLRALDALYWWLTDGEIWLSVMGFKVSSDELLYRLVDRGWYDGKANRHSRTR